MAMCSTVQKYAGQNILVTLILFFNVFSCVISSHFRGGIIMVRPKPGAVRSNAQRQVEISYHISWRRSSLPCDSQTVANGNLIGTGFLTCQYGCHGNVVQMLYICTDFSVAEDWSFGERRIDYDFSISAINKIAIGFIGYDWISPFNSHWNISTTFSLEIRNDTGQMNSSPRAITSPVLRLQEGCNHTIPLSVSDPDGDIIRCRWAVGRECAGICNAIPGAQLDSDTCTIQYMANRGSRYKAAAIMIEDFIPRSPQPLSNVALQFLLLIVASTESCSQQPEFIGPTLPQGACVALPPNSTFTTQLTADSGGTGIAIAEIQTVSPIGTRRGELQHIEGTNIYFVNVTWTPAPNQQNETHLICYTAVNSEGLASEQTCAQLLAGIFPPAPLLNTAKPNQRLVHPSNVTWYIKFDREIQRSLVSSYIIFYEFVSEVEVYRIDASLSPQVSFDQSNGITIRPNYSFAEKGKFYINFERRVVRSTEVCGPPNEPVTTKQLWTFDVLDVTPPVITLLQNPIISKGNISLEWESNEIVMWQCNLEQESMTMSVNCTAANWRVSSFEKVYYNSTYLCNDGPGRLSELKVSTSLGFSEFINIDIFVKGMRLNSALEPGEKASIDIKLSTLKPLQGVFTIIVQSFQGTFLQITVNFRINPILPNLLIEPSSVNTRIIRGTSRILEFVVTNTGRTVANDVHSLLPKNDFVSFVSFGNLNHNESSLNLESGEKAILSLLVQTPAYQKLGDVSAAVAIISTQVSSSIPMRLTVSSNLLMNLTVIVEDEFTYFASGRPLVNDAAVTLINYQRSVRITLTTDAGNGTVLFTDLHEDRYEMFVEAPDHLSVRQVIITSVDNPVITMFLQRQTVTYTRSVTPVTFEDVYEIAVEADFVTHVPIPIVTVNPTEIDIELFELGFYSAFQVNITNHGLIRANSTNLQLPDSHPFLEFTTDTTELGYIEPLSSIIVIVNVTHKDTKRQADSSQCTPPRNNKLDNVLIAGSIVATAATALAAFRNQITAAFELTKWIVYGLNIIYNYICGNLQSRTVPLLFKKLQCIEPSESSVKARPTAAIVYQPPRSVVQCTACGRGSQGGNFNFQGYSADTLGFCNSCVSVVLGCWPTPDFPLAGCIPLVAAGAPKIEIKDIVLTVLKWVGCLLGSSKKAKVKASSQWLQAGLCAYDTIKCLKEASEAIKSRQKRNIDNMLHDLFESMFPIVQSIELATEVLGDKAWLSVGNETWVSKVLQPILDDNSEAGALISVTELSAIVAAPILDRTTPEMIQKMAMRLNNTLHNWNNGNLEPLEGYNQASFSMVEKLNKDINTYNEIAIGKGFSSYLDAYNFFSGEVNKLDSWENAAGVCAVVRIRIEQELAVTRTAFVAKLEIENKESSPLSNGDLDILIIDSDTSEKATHLFAIGNGTLSSSLTNGNGGWKLPSKASGNIEWLIIPYSEAAPEFDRSYDVGGTLRYSLDGENVTIPLVPTVITITPDPSLLVHYFWEKFVIGDDPFTDEVEGSVPFTLGVAVKNAGRGVANSLRITSGQPEIVDNERGLLINFMIISAMIGNGNVEPSLTVHFGDLPPDTTKVARWQIISNLQGKFQNYSATFENINPLGDPNLSILDELEIHELIRNVRIYNSPEDDGVLDFLVNELNDLLVYPDALYSSKTLERYNVSSGTILSVHSITATLLEVRTFVNSTGWVYYRYNDTKSVLQKSALTVNVTKKTTNSTIKLPLENSWITGNDSAKLFDFHIIDNITEPGEVLFIVNLCSSDCHSAEMKFTRAMTAPVVNFNQSAYSVDENDGPAQPVLVLSNPLSTDTTIKVFSTDGSATGKDRFHVAVDQDEKGNDYSFGPRNVTIPAGQIIVPIDVLINQDAVLEETEEFVLTIDQSSSLNGVIIGNPNIVIINITDDSPVAASINFSQPKYIAQESNGSVQPILTLSKPLLHDITVLVISKSRAATGGGVDYSSGPYNVTIPAGQISVPFDIQINNDNVTEGSEKFIIKITKLLPADNVIITHPNKSTVNILDNDCIPCVIQDVREDITGSNVTITFSSSDPVATFKCKLDKGSFVSCTSPMTYAQLSKGKHRITVAAKCSVKCGRLKKKRYYLKVLV